MRGQIELGGNPIEIMDFIQVINEARTVSVCGLEDDTVALVVEGRTRCKMWLTRESFVTLIVACVAYLQEKGIALPESVQIVYSDNLKK